MCNVCKMRWMWCLSLLALLHTSIEASEKTPPDSVNHKSLSEFLIDLPLTATEQSIDLAQWLGKRQQFTFRSVPYGFTGLPILYYSQSTGWNFGGLVQWVDYRRFPYRYKGSLQLLHSTESRAKYKLKVEMPSIKGTEFGLQVQASFERDIRYRYYGLGNNSVINKDLTDPSSPDFKDESYYIYELERPRLIARLLRRLRGPLSTVVVLGLESTVVNKRGEQAFFIDQGTVVESNDQLSGFVGLTFQWDTRDDEVRPLRGVFHEWSYETSRGVLLDFLAREIDFARATFTDIRYFPLTRRLNLANRMVFEVLADDVPLYAFGEIGGSRRTKGLGGSDSLRGFDRQRFTDKVRAFSNTELRYLLRSIEPFHQYFEWHAAVFVDGGRVWPALDELSLTGTHWSAGLGLRLFWDMNFVTRLDVGLSSEQEYVSLKLSNVF